MEKVSSQEYNLPKGTQIAPKKGLLDTNALFKEISQPYLELVSFMKHFGLKVEQVLHSTFHVEFFQAKTLPTPSGSHYLPYFRYTPVFFTN